MNPASGFLPLRSGTPLKDCSLTAEPDGTHMGVRHNASVSAVGAGWDWRSAQPGHPVAEGLPVVPATQNPGAGPAKPGPESCPDGTGDDAAYPATPPVPGSAGFCRASALFCSWPVRGLRC